LWLGSFPYNKQQSSSTPSQEPAGGMMPLPFGTTPDQIMSGNPIPMQQQHYT
jgi:hypothetical protein